eukprot:TRINITY_DN3976_c0_g1_i1.p1 TRINITY_DN3976_c0_g1~~TRINITY_DN3976_c0_g1_i1.p1  ORF type:complete len:964 (+),score=201.10 TRINITY_DN3976_c0_g1_i1:147-2894(+)
MRPPGPAALELSPQGSSDSRESEMQHEREEDGGCGAVSAAADGALPAGVIDSPSLPGAPPPLCPDMQGDVRMRDGGGSSSSSPTLARTLQQLPARCRSPRLTRLAARPRVDVSHRGSSSSSPRSDTLPEEGPLPVPPGSVVLQTAAAQRRDSLGGRGSVGCARALLGHTPSPTPWAAQGAGPGFGRSDGGGSTPTALRVLGQPPQLGRCTRRSSGAQPEAQINPFSPRGLPLGSAPPTPGAEKRQHHPGALSPVSFGSRLARGHSPHPSYVSASRGASPVPGRLSALPPTLGMLSPAREMTVPPALQRRTPATATPWGYHGASLDTSRTSSGGNPDSSAGDSACLSEGLRLTGAGRAPCSPPPVGAGGATPPPPRRNHGQPFGDVEMSPPPALTASPRASCNGTPLRTPMPRRVASPSESGTMTSPRVTGAALAGLGEEPSDADILAQVTPERAGRSALRLSSATHICGSPTGPLRRIGPVPTHPHTARPLSMTCPSLVPTPLGGALSERLNAHQLQGGMFPPVVPAPALCSPRRATDPCEAPRSAGHSTPQRSVRAWELCGSPPAAAAAMAEAVSANGSPREATLPPHRDGEEDALAGCAARLRGDFDIDFWDDAAGRVTTRHVVEENGRTYVAWKHLDGMQFAVKVCDPLGADTPQGSSPEFKALLALQREHCGEPLGLRYYDSWLEGGRMFIRTELPLLGSARDLLFRDPELCHHTATIDAFTGCIGMALRVVHAAGVAHGAVSLEAAVCVRRCGRPHEAVGSWHFKLARLGSARLLRAQGRATRAAAAAADWRQLGISALELAGVLSGDEAAAARQEARCGPVPAAEAALKKLSSGLISGPVRTRIDRMLQGADPERLSPVHGAKHSSADYLEALVHELHRLQGEKAALQGAFAGPELQGPAGGGPLWAQP